jgi:PTS system mannose-specific IID component
MMRTGGPGVAGSRRAAGAKALLAVVFRSFFLQAAWNYERMQALGFASALAHSARRLAPGAEERAAFLARHLKRFNTNPVLASYILGAVLRMEEEGRDPAEIERFKRGTEAPLAAWGDALFWGTLRPLGTSAAFATAAALGAGPPAAAFAPLAYAVVYNVLHLYHRVRGVFRGHDRGARVLEDLMRSPIRRLPVILARSGLVLAGFGAALEVTRAGGVRGLPTTLLAAIMAALALFAVRALRVPVVLAATALLALLGGAGALGWVGR